MLSAPEVRNKVADDMTDACIFEDASVSLREEIVPLPTAIVTAKGTVITVPPAAPLALASARSVGGATRSSRSIKVSPTGAAR